MNTDPGDPVCSFSKPTTTMCDCVTEALGPRRRESAIQYTPFTPVPFAKPDLIQVISRYHGDSSVSARGLWSKFDLNSDLYFRDKHANKNPDDGSSGRIWISDGASKTLYDLRKPTFLFNSNLKGVLSDFFNQSSNRIIFTNNPDWEI